MAQYLVTWMGSVTGSTAGRDDGYPEQKMTLVDEKRLWEYTARPEVHFYKIAHCDVSALVAQQNQDHIIREQQRQLDKQAAYAKLSPKERDLLGVTPFNRRKK